MREIRFYRTAGGDSPVRRFLDSLPGEQARKVFWVLRLVEELERVPARYLKKLHGTRHLWEIRADFGGEAFRILGFFDDTGSLVVSNGFSKKSERVPAREIAQAERCRRDYLSRGKYE